MVKTEYITETDSLKLTMGKEEEIVDFKDFMDTISAERARIEYLLALISQVRKDRVTETNKFILTVGGIMKKQAAIRDRMDKAVEDGDYKKNSALQKVHKALLDEKNTYREIRYAIKLLDTDEARLKTELLEILA